MAATTRGRGLIAANTAMALGVLPMLGWLGMLVRSVFRVESGRFGLTDLMFVGVAGVGAYLVTFVVAGAGAIWAAVLVRACTGRARRFTRILVSFTAGMLLLPWVIVLALEVMRWFD